MEIIRFPGKHLSLHELQKEQIKNDYIYNDVPPYPGPELHVTRVGHSTELRGLQGIQSAGGFRNSKEADSPKLVWFSLAVSLQELMDAEARGVTLIQQAQRREEGPKEARRVPKGTLQKFATSPSFGSRSRYGWLRFTFSLKDVLDKYSQQFCGGQRPVLRVFRTDVYKPEVMYAVLVHSPADEMFSEYPLLEDTPWSICAFRAEPEPHFVWRPQAMADSLKFSLVDEGRSVQVNPVEDRPGGVPYVWDHVTLAVHVGNQLLEFAEDELRENVWFCEPDSRPVSRDTRYLAFGEAEATVREVWPGLRLKRFSDSQLHICS